MHLYFPKMSFFFPHEFNKILACHQDSNFKNLSGNTINDFLFLWNKDFQIYQRFERIQKICMKTIYILKVNLILIIPWKSQCSYTKHNQTKLYFQHYQNVLYFKNEPLCWVCHWGTLIISNIKIYLVLSFRNIYLPIWKIRKITATDNILKRGTYSPWV